MGELGLAWGAGGSFLTFFHFYGAWAPGPMVQGPWDPYSIVLHNLKNMCLVLYCLLNCLLYCLLPIAFPPLPIARMFTVNVLRNALAVAASFNFNYRLPLTRAALTTAYRVRF